MKIQKINWQHRRDFEAVYECEHCGDTHISDGYDDYNFHTNVIPKMECPNCGETASAEYKPRETKYRANEIV
jgi:predicted RNA-binding Zn-ribbon protein involved in translation (DUF1610 family)